MQINKTDNYIQLPILYAVLIAESSQKYFKKERNEMAKCIIKTLFFKYISYSN